MTLPPHPCQGQTFLHHRPRDNFTISGPVVASVDTCAKPSVASERTYAEIPTSDIVTSQRSVERFNPHLTLTSPHLTSPHLTSPHLTSPHLTSPHLTSPHLTTPHHTTPHHTTPHHPLSHPPTPPRSSASCQTISACSCWFKNMLWASVKWSVATSPGP